MTWLLSFSNVKGSGNIIALNFLDLIIQLSSSEDS